jgi:hypothetical protein
MVISLRVSGFLLALLVAGTSQGAGVYRWVDAQGRTHFGDRPPPEAQAEQLALPRPGTSPAAPPADDAGRAEARRKLLEYYDDKRSEEKAAEEQAGRERAAREAACRQARQALRRYTSTGRIFKPTPDGGRAYLSAAERDALIQALESQASRVCD